MKSLLVIVTILIFCNVVSHAQSGNLNKTRLIRICDGDSTYIARLFEIDIDKKKIYMINPIMNYLDIKGGKPKYRIKIKREKWDIIEKLLSEINLSEYEKAPLNNKSYSIILFSEDNKDSVYTTQVECELKKLKDIIKTMRK